MHTFGRPSYSSQVNIGSTIYGTDLICDFLLYHPEKLASRAWSSRQKWQQVGGTVDEKYPYFVNEHLVF